MIIIVIEPSETPGAIQLTVIIIIIIVTIRAIVTTTAHPCCPYCGCWLMLVAQLHKALKGFVQRFGADSKTSALCAGTAANPCSTGIRVNDT